MRIPVKNLFGIWLFASLVCSATANAQTPQPTNPQKQVDSTQKQAQPNTGAEAQVPADAQLSDDSVEMERLRKDVRKLTLDVESLRKRVNDLEKDRLFDMTRVLLLREEQRAEALHAKIRETMEKQTVLQVRLEQLDQQMRPENIERMFTGIGSVRPDADREMVRRRIVTERVGVMAQIELLRQERSRFQASLATADVAIQRLRLRLSEAARP